MVPRVFEPAAVQRAAHVLAVRAGPSLLKLGRLSPRCEFAEGAGVILDRVETLLSYEGKLQLEEARRHEVRHFRCDAQRRLDSW